MARSKGTTVRQYLAALAPERRSALEAVRRVIVKNLPRGFQEGILFRSIGYYVPLSVHPDTYNGQPLMLAALASHKSTMTLYLMNVYSDSKLRRWFEREYEKSGKKLRMGKSCVHFKSLDDLPLPVIGRAIAKTSLETFVTRYERGRKKNAADQAPGKTRGQKTLAGMRSRS